MYTRRTLLGALFAGSLAYLFSASGNPATPQHEPYIQGRNKTVLFITNSEHGLSNVHLATSSALLENYPDIDVHYASFPSVQPKLERISSFARARNSAARDIIFHEIEGKTFAYAVLVGGTAFTAPPASAGIAALTEHMQFWISPWSVEHHMEIFESLSGIIEKVDPAVVVLDTWLRPAIDVTRDKNRQHAIITPNINVDNFLASQPLGSRFWKYPATASGFNFPVPLRKIPENIYLNLRFIYSAMRTPALSAKKAALREKGLKDPINFFGIHRPDVPWITQTTEGATIPVDVVPPNVTSAGPIFLSGASASHQDPELADWIKKAPTVLFNLGSHFAYSEHQATVMSVAIAEVLEKTKVQIIWKFNKAGEYPDDVLSPLRPYIDSSRLRMPNWLTADPTSLLETGDIVASVHHGGAGCYHEAIATGLPQVILPLWADLYNYAALVENIGVGIWGCREESPEWTSECLSSSFLRALDGGPDSVSFSDKAKQVGVMVQARDKGRDIAAREIAKLAYVR